MMRQIEWRRRRRKRRGEEGIEATIYALMELTR